MKEFARPHTRSLLWPPSHGAIRDGRVVRRGRRSATVTGHDDSGAVGTDGKSGSLVEAGRWPVVAFDPELRVGGSVVCDGRVVDIVGIVGGPEAMTRYEHGGAIRCDPDAGSLVGVPRKAKQPGP